MSIFRRSDFDLIVIGSGSGGGVAASLVAGTGRRVAIIEREQVMGGECPNWACIPTKALLHAAHVYETVLDAHSYGTTVEKVSLNYKAVRAWKDLVVSRTGTADGEQVFSDQGIKVIKAEAKFINRHEVVAGGKTYRARNFLVATGTTNFVPPIPGLKQAGYISFREAVDLPKPPKSLFIIGGGPIGCEFAQVFSSFGTKIYIADALPRLLARSESEAGELVGAVFASRGIEVLTNCLATRVTTQGSKKVVHYKIGRIEHQVTVDEILVAAGKKPLVEIGLEEIGVKTGRGGIITNAYMQTNLPHIYAAGDVVGPYQFTHTAAYQSHIAGYNMYHRKKLKADYSVIPTCIFVRPEVASVGLGEEEARGKGLKIKVGSTPVSILGRANTTNDANGFVKVIVNEKGVIIGGTIVASRAGEMIHELALAIKLRAKASDIIGTVHAFPTFSEAVRIACLNLS